MFTLKEVVDQIKGNDKIYYVYFLHKPDGVIFYVGKGKFRKKGQRITHHEYEAKSDKLLLSDPRINRFKIYTIRKIWKQGKQISYSIDSWHDIEESAYDREMELIASIGRKIDGKGPLTNISEGGEKEGTPEEVNRKISKTLKQYYKDNPHVLKEMSERQANYFEENPIARENAKKNAIKNEIHKNLAKWKEENPEKIIERGKCHREYMKKWHKENQDKTKEISSKRNEKFRTKEHREHMAEKTSEYIKTNPDWYKGTREKVRQTILKKQSIEQECLIFIRDKLYEEGKLSKKTDRIAKWQLHLWKKRGLLPINLPLGGSTIEEWEKYKKELMS